MNSSRRRRPRSLDRGRPMGQGRSFAHSLNIETRRLFVRFGRKRMRISCVGRSVGVQASRLFRYPGGAFWLDSFNATCRLTKERTIRIKLRLYKESISESDSHQNAKAGCLNNYGLTSDLIPTFEPKKTKKKRGGGAVTTIGHGYGVHPSHMGRR